MVNKLGESNRKSGMNLVVFQMVLVFVIAIIFTVTLDAKAGISSLAGGVAFVLPNIIFVLMAFAHAGATKTKLVLRGVYGGEAIKLLLTVILLSLFLKYIPLSLSVFYISFSILVISQWFSPFFFYNNDGIKHG